MGITNVPYILILAVADAYIEMDATFSIVAKVALYTGISNNYLDEGSGCFICRSGYMYISIYTVLCTYQYRFCPKKQHTLSQQIQFLMLGERN